MYNLLPPPLLAPISLPLRPAGYCSFHLPAKLIKPAISVPVIPLACRFINIIKVGASLKVVSNAPADTITGPIPLPRANKVAASGEEDSDSLVVPSTEIAVPTTKGIGV